MCFARIHILIIHLKVIGGGRTEDEMFVLVSSDRLSIFIGNVAKNATGPGRNTLELPSPKNVTNWNRTGHPSGHQCKIPVVCRSITVTVGHCARARPQESDLTDLNDQIVRRVNFVPL